jgi:S1-C subfamily serine protease
MKKSYWGKTITAILFAVFLISCCGKINQNNVKFRMGDNPFDPETAYFIHQDLYIPGVLFGIPDIPIGTMSGSGSGIRHGQKYTDILTAGHVCELPEEVISLGGKQKISLFNIEGEQFSGEIYAIDYPNDLCIIRIREKRPVLRLAKRNPKSGDHVYSAGYPHGLYEPGLLHYFHGYFSGIDSIRTGYYSFPASPGSSGSAIVDSRGNVVGVVSAVMVDFHHSTIGPSVEPIYIFLLQTKNCDNFCIK